MAESKDESKREIFSPLQYLRVRKDPRTLEQQHNGERIGYYLDPFQVNVFLRPAVSVIVGVLVSAFIYLVGLATGSNLYPWWAALMFAALLSLFFALNDEAKPVKVPNAHVAILTFFGFRLDVYLEEGDYYWFGKKIGLKPSTDPLPNASTPGEEEGFVFTGERQLEIWARKTADDKGLMLDNAARDVSKVFTKLTVLIQTVWPREWANSFDPILDTAERSRSALRTITSFFSGVDNVVVKSAFSSLMAGRTLVSAFTSKPHGIHPRGSVIQDRSGTPLYKITDPIKDAKSRKDFEEKRKVQVEKAKEDVRKKIEEEGDPEMLKVVHRQGGVIEVKERWVEEHLIEVMDEVGAFFKHATVSSVLVSDQVFEQANIASGESFEQVAQIRSAETIREVRKILSENADAPGSEFATLVALAKDGHAKIVYVPNADRLTRAAVAGANEIGGN